MRYLIQNPYVDREANTDKLPAKLAPFAVITHVASGCQLASTGRNPVFLSADLTQSIPHVSIAQFGHICDRIDAGESLADIIRGGW